MPRSDGFPVMDVSTDILNDPKFRRVQRSGQALVAPAVMAYTAVMAESWKAGSRVSVVDAWPALIPYDDGVVSAMKDAHLLDRTGQVPAKTWKEWFEPARKRRDAARDRWARANQRRVIPSTNDSAVTALSPHEDRAVTTRSPRGNGAVTASTVPTVPSVPSVPSESVGSSGHPRPPRARGGAPSRPSLDDLPFDVLPPTTTTTDEDTR